MAMPRRIKVAQDEVFPFGAFLVSEVTPVWDFEKSTRDQRIQQIDKTRACCCGRSRFSMPTRRRPSGRRRSA